MPVKIRLKREGRKKRPFYHIVIADSRAPRDGRFIEKIGYYDPSTNPATIELEFDKALDWLQKGAQPTDTCRTILSYKGVLYKKHLLKGVAKGAFSEEEAEKRFQAWMEEKQARIVAKAERIKKGMEDERKKRLSEEAKVNEARAEEIAKKQSALVEEIAAAAKGEGDAEEEAEDAGVTAEASEEVAAPAEKAEAEGAESDTAEAPETEAEKEASEAESTPKAETPDASAKAETQQETQTAAEPEASEKESSEKETPDTEEKKDPTEEA